MMRKFDLNKVYLRESELKRDCKKWLVANGWFVQHIQVGKIPGRRNVSKGVWDTYIAKDGVSVWLEFKVRDRQLTAEQMEFESYLHVARIPRIVVRSFNDLLRLKFYKKEKQHVQSR